MQHLLLSIFFCFLSLVLYAQTNNTDKVLGVWLNEDKDSKIEIFKNGNVYYGKMIWGNTIFEEDGRTSKTDVNNPDESLKSRPLLNMVTLSDFTFIDGIWDNGKIYDTKSGKSYSCTIKLNGDKLEIRSYVGISLLGHSTYWEKSE